MSHNSDKPVRDANSPDLRTISALCVSGRSIYKYLPGVECFDKRKDARQFAGHTPVIAHPPCRLWSKYLSHQAKSPDAGAERELGRWCVRTVIGCGGVLEQPAHSALWKEMDLPMPNERPRYVAFNVTAEKTEAKFVFSIYVEQSWFGYASRKPTWLLICGVPISSMQRLPFRFEFKRANATGLSSFGRSRTITAFAEYLCQIARLSKP